MSDKPQGLIKLKKADAKKLLEVMSADKQLQLESESYRGTLLLWGEEIDKSRKQTNKITSQINLFLKVKQYHPWVGKKLEKLKQEFDKQISIYENKEIQKYAAIKNLDKLHDKIKKSKEKIMTLYATISRKYNVQLMFVNYRVDWNKGYFVLEDERWLEESKSAFTEYEKIIGINNNQEVKMDDQEKIQADVEKVEEAIANGDVTAEEVANAEIVDETDEPTTDEVDGTEETQVA